MSQAIRGRRSKVGGPLRRPDRACEALRYGEAGLFALRACRSMMSWWWPQLSFFRSMGPPRRGSTACFSSTRSSAASSSTRRSSATRRENRKWSVEDQEERDARDHSEEDLRPEHGDEDGGELHLAEPEPVGVEADDPAGRAQEGYSGEGEDQPRDTADSHGAALPRWVHRRAVDSARRARTESRITVVMVAARRGL